jgi:trans-2,3-dihydro-3-hydroxyanthranilate isomerase
MKKVTTSGLNRFSRHFTQEIGDDLLPVEIRCEGQQLVSVVLTQSPPDFGNICEDLRAESGGSSGIGEGGPFTLSTVTSGFHGGQASSSTCPEPGCHCPCPSRRSTVGKSSACGWWEGCYLYCFDPVSSSSVAHARFFNPTMGIVEDSATGAAAGPLACQLVRHGIVKDGSTMMIEQGYEMKRPSLLSVEVQDKVVRLAGRGVTVIKGTMRIE